MDVIHSFFFLLISQSSQFENILLSSFLFLSRRIFSSFSSLSGEECTLLSTMPLLFTFSLRSKAYNLRLSILVLITFKLFSVGRVVNYQTPILCSVFWNPVLDFLFEGDFFCTSSRFSMSSTPLLTLSSPTLHFHMNR